MPKLLTSLILALMLTCSCSATQSSHVSRSPGREVYHSFQVRDHVLYIGTVAIPSCTDCSKIQDNPAWHSGVWERHKTLVVYALLLFAVIGIMTYKWKKLKQARQ